MTEEFISYLWKFRLLKNNLITTSGEPCKVVETGTHNINAGPDFFNARVLIGDTLWAGNVEIHMLASDWYRHKHHFDNKYDNVILHLVHTEDKSVKRKNGELIPTLEVAGLFDNTLFEIYQGLLASKSWIPCQPFIHNVSRFLINSWIDRVLAERLEIKSKSIFEKLEYNNNDWSETFYQLLARNFGFNTNSVPFELLARSLPLRILTKHKENLFQIEALIYGQAGFLKENLKDEYFQKLKREYLFLEKKYQLKPIDGSMWHFLRLRPSNFPTLRLAQFAFLVHKSSHLLSKVLENEKIDDLYELFTAEASDFWTTHYTFKKKALKRSKTLGKSAIQLILINTVIPFLFAYGEETFNQQIKDRALRLLDMIPGEVNSQTRKWKELGLNTQTAFNTQALMELKSNYCNSKKCLSCAIGIEVIKNP
ncbi:MAG: DUF2851 family protein [Bacteroidales bacterium]|nr:DUF2851 family protein [Bacteroidales bacterium]MCF8404790.1 DUF2851 family protein [Bacteroidales bacterium]